MRLTFCLLLGFAFFCSNCKKKSTDSNDQMKRGLLEGPWRYDTGGIDADNNGTIDSPFPAGFIQSCEADNIIVFQADGNGTVDEGQTKCNVSDPQVSYFKWVFKNNDTILNIPDSLYGVPGGDLKINALTSTKLELEKQVQITTPITTTVYSIIDLKH